MAGLPTLYKRNQGQLTRSLTALGLGVVLAALCWYMHTMLLTYLPTSEPRNVEIHNAVDKFVLTEEYTARETVDGQSQEVKFPAGTLVTKDVEAKLVKVGVNVVKAAPRDPVPGGFWIQYGGPVVVLFVGAFFIFMSVNTPKFADFLIATESEMKKVSWSTRQELIGSTAVVIVTVILLAVIIYVSDFLVIRGLSAIKAY